MNFLKKLVLWIVGLSIASLVLVTLFAIYGNVSEGERIGTIIKLSKKGYVFKTHEGQLNTGEISEGLWNFSVKRSNKKVLADLSNAMKSGHRVSLYYDQKFVSIPFFGDTKYFITEVEVLED